MNKLNFNHIIEKIKSKKMNINISLFITGVVFFIFTVDAMENTTKSFYFLIPSGICFAIWIIITQGADKIDHLATEAARLAIVIIVLPLCLEFYLNEENFNGFSLSLILFYIGLFYCIYYFVSKLNNAIHFTKDILERIKMQLFKNTKSSDKRSIHVIENITTFLVAIGGLAVAIKVIIEAMSQIIGYIK